MHQLAITAFIFLIYSASAQASQKLEVTPFCHADDTRLAFFTTLDIDINSKGEKSKGRYLYKATCQVQSSTCIAVAIKLDNLDSGRPMDILDVVLPDSMQIVNRTNKVFTLGWGPFITLTVDLPANRITYRESAPDFENSGTGYCSKKISKR